MVNISSRLKKLRIDSKLTQIQVAERIGVVDSVISSYESGARYPSLNNIIKLAALYHVSVDYLLGLDHHKMLDVDGLNDEEINVLVQMLDILRSRKSE